MVGGGTPSKLLLLFSFLVVKHSLQLQLLNVARFGSMVDNQRIRKVGDEAASVDLYNVYLLSRLLRGGNQLNDINDKQSINPNYQPYRIVVSGDLDWLGLIEN